MPAKSSKDINRRDFFKRSAATGAGIAAVQAIPSGGDPVEAQSAVRTGRKVLIMSDMEGVDGIFNWADQCNPLKSPRWKESQQLLTGEVNAAVEGLFAGGATEVVVWGGHDGGRALPASDIHPRARLPIGSPIPPIREFNSTFSAIVFVGQHAMAGAEGRVFQHSEPLGEWQAHRGDWNSGNGGG